MIKEQIGSCTLYHADCLEILDTLGKVDNVITDPPYGMSYVSARRKHKYDPIENDNNADIAKEVIDWAVKNANYAVYAFGRWENIIEYPVPKSVITWIKNNWGSGDLLHSHARQTEMIFFYPCQRHEWGGAKTDRYNLRR